MLHFKLAFQYIKKNLSRSLSIILSISIGIAIILGAGVINENVEKADIEGLRYEIGNYHLKINNIDKEIIYAAALIHDIGRSSKYSKGLDHEEAGALLAEEILKACDFSCEEITMIKEAILAHRNTETKNSDGLNGLLYRADKKSRMCLFCHANEQCKWSEEKMNLKVDI